MPDAFADLSLEAVKSGNEPAIAEFTSVFRPRLMRFARDRRLSHLDCEEVVQDTLFAAITHIKAGTFRGESNLSTWLVAILRNKLADRHRKEFRDQDRVQALNLHIQKDASTDCSERLDVQIDIEWALAKLPMISRAVLLLHETEQRTLQEIASALRLSESKTYRTLKDAKVRLHRLLSDAGYRSRPDDQSASDNCSGGEN
jgi:RNA polymerase sigma-70 factor (ECF subfamily)